MSAVLKSEAKQTPGPWKECGGQVVQAYAPYDTIATTYDDRKPTEDSANAKLIAAAPEMAEALRLTLDAFRECVGHAAWADFEESNPAVLIARAALAKAGL